MNWRAAKSLLVYRDQINKQYPNRSKAADGLIGDDVHSKRTSDHNPNKDGVVTAFDLTHDPKSGVDIQKEADRLVSSRDSRIKYIIANKRILEPAYGWEWKPYKGLDPHTGHLHLSVHPWNGDVENSWRLDKGETMTTQEVDEMILATYLRIAGRVPTDPEFDLHRKQYAAEGDKWWLAMVRGFKGDDVAWTKYERNLKDANKKMTDNPDSKVVKEIEDILERR